MSAAASDTTETDEELASIVARGGSYDRAPAPARAALERLYERHAPLLLAFIAARTRFEVHEDLHQEVWAKVWARLPTHFDGRNFRAWLYEIARNIVIDHGRRRRPEPLADPSTVRDGRATDEDVAMRREETEVLRGCVDRLDPPSASVVRALWSGESYEKLCPRLGLTQNQAYKLFHRAKDSLRICMERALR